MCCPSTADTFSCIGCILGSFLQCASPSSFLSLMCYTSIGCPLSRFYCKAGLKSFRFQQCGSTGVRVEVFFLPSHWIYNFQLPSLTRPTFTFSVNVTFDFSSQAGREGGVFMWTGFWKVCQSGELNEKEIDIKEKILEKYYIELEN